VARQDLNLQPSGYEPVGHTEMSAENLHFLTQLEPIVAVWFRRFVGYSLVRMHSLALRNDGNMG
jgi:hypothetical protein